jgi:Eukaryotic DNA topoisomerase I, catalytic core
VATTTTKMLTPREDNGSSILDGHKMSSNRNRSNPYVPFTAVLVQCKRHSTVLSTVPSFPRPNHGPHGCRDRQTAPYNLYGTLRSLTRSNSTTRSLWEQVFKNIMIFKRATKMTRTTQYFVFVLSTPVLILSLALALASLGILNKHLQLYMKDLSANVSRTYNASRAS